MITIYIITNLANGKAYVGQTSQKLQARLKSHFSAARRFGGCRYLSEAIRKHGERSFVIQELMHAETKHDAARAERAMIRLFGAKDKSCGYNLSGGGEIGSSGCKWSPESRKKLSRSTLGNQRCAGRKHSEESKAKTRASLLGHEVPQEVREKIRASLLARNSGSAYPCH